MNCKYSAQTPSKSKNYLASLFPRPLPWGGGHPLLKPYLPRRLDTRVCGARPVGASIPTLSALEFAPVCKLWIRHSMYV